MKGPILITGAQGMLGTDLTQFFKSECPSLEVFSLSRNELDIQNEEDVFEKVREIRPVSILNAAAYTNVDLAETERREAFAINVSGPKYLAQAAHEFGARLVHFSTDQVFDGSHQSPYSEKEVPNPLNYYAKTKLLGEHEIAKLNAALILRVQWLYGEKKNRFTSLKDKPFFTPFADQFGTPTWTKEIARIVFRLLKKNARGLYHLAYEDPASWADVYSFVKSEMGYSVELIPKMTDSLNLPANRPKYSVLSNKKLLKTLGLQSLGSWKDPLRDFLKLF